MHEFLLDAMPMHTEVNMGCLEVAELFVESSMTSSDIVSSVFGPASIQKLPVDHCQSSEQPAIVWFCGNAMTAPGAL